MCSRHLNSTFVNYTVRPFLVVCAVRVLGNSRRWAVFISPGPYSHPRPYNLRIKEIIGGQRLYKDDLTFLLQLITAALLGISSAARLDSVYLPPGASGAGGGPGLTTPVRGGGGRFRGN